MSNNGTWIIQELWGNELVKNWLDYLIEKTGKPEKREVFIEHLKKCPFQETKEDSYRVVNNLIEGILEGKI